MLIAEETAEFIEKTGKYIVSYLQKEIENNFELDKMGSLSMGISVIQGTLLGLYGCALKVNPDKSSEILIIIKKQFNSFYKVLRKNKKKV